MARTISVIIPTLDAADVIDAQLDALARQTLPPDEIIVVDSSAADDTAARAAAHPGVKVIPISRKDFDHGGTRDMALRQSIGELVVFMTQDALPADDTLLERLTAPFADPEVAIVGGRQVAHETARPAEKLVRAHNYPAENRVWSAQDIPQLGLRAFQISDVCAAYRRDIYLAVGGFDRPIPTNEDMLMTERMLHAGYKAAYMGDAVVWHSHNFTFRQEFTRNRLIGQVLQRYARRLEYVSEIGLGASLARYVLSGLLKKGQIGECFFFCKSCAARFAGNRAGHMDERNYAHRVLDKG